MKDCVATEAHKQGVSSLPAAPCVVPQHSLPLLWSTCIYEAMSTAVWTCTCVSWKFSYWKGIGLYLFAFFICCVFCLNLLFRIPFWLKWNSEKSIKSWGSVNLHERNLLVYVAVTRNWKSTSTCPFPVLGPLPQGLHVTLVWMSNNILNGECVGSYDCGTTQGRFWVLG